MPKNVLFFVLALAIVAAGIFAFTPIFKAQTAVATGGSNSDCGYWNCIEWGTNNADETGCTKYVWQKITGANCGPFSSKFAVPANAAPGSM